MARAMPRQVLRSADCGLSRQACSSRAMNAVSSSRGTLCGSRQGGAGSDDCGDLSIVAVVVAMRPSDIVRTSVLLHADSVRLEDKFGIPERAHLGDVQTLELDLRRDTVSPHGFDDHVQ